MIPVLDGSFVAGPLSTTSFHGQPDQCIVR